MRVECVFDQRPVGFVFGAPACLFRQSRPGKFVIESDCSSLWPYCDCDPSSFTRVDLSSASLRSTLVVQQERARVSTTSPPTFYGLSHALLFHVYAFFLYLHRCFRRHDWSVKRRIRRTVSVALRRLIVSFLLSNRRVVPHIAFPLLEGQPRRTRQIPATVHSKAHPLHDRPATVKNHL